MELNLLMNFGNNMKPETLAVLVEAVERITHHPKEGKMDDKSVRWYGLVLREVLNARGWTTDEIVKLGKSIGRE